PRKIHRDAPWPAKPGREFHTGIHVLVSNQAPEPRPRGKEKYPDLSCSGKCRCVSEEQMPRLQRKERAGLPARSAPRGKGPPVCEESSPESMMCVRCFPAICRGAPA